MYDVLPRLEGTSSIRVFDLVDDSYIGEYPFEGTCFEGEPFPLRKETYDEWEPLYNNIEVTNPAWPGGKLQILQDYGNHEGACPGVSIDETLVLLGSKLGDESLGWFDGYYCLIADLPACLGIFRLMKAPAPIDLGAINQKRPFNSHWYADSEDKDSPIKVSFIIPGITDDWETIVLKITVGDIYCPSYWDSIWNYGYREGRMTLQ